MRRREFLKGMVAAGGVALGGSLPHRMCAATGESEIKTVHLVFKTHLDIGFTDLATNVIRRYFDDFIPRAMELAASVRRGGTQDRFVWTVGSWLVYEYLEQSGPAQRQRMERAIEAGDIVWHGLAMTTHTEMMDRSLLEASLGISAALDKRFGRKTIAAKMTDVPGHTRSIVGPLAREGIRFLHIGVNPASKPPDVPPLCLWRDADGAEIILMYQKDYGSIMTVPGTDTAIAISFTGDNHGPQSPDQIAAIYRDLRRQFPGAQIVASTFNAIAARLEEVRGRLPVVTQELGDTWIHGIGSDPKMTARFRELCRLRREWLAEGKIKARDATDLAFARHLILVPEHTWGLDVKSYLQDWDIYAPAAFMASRGKENFKKIEVSWAEKRAHIDDATATLPGDLARQAQQRLKAMEPRELQMEGMTAMADPAAEIRSRHFILALDRATGAIRRLRHIQSGREWASPDHLMGVFGYQTFSQEEYDRFMKQYLTQRPDWAVADFGKPGMVRVNPQSRMLTPSLKQAMIGQDERGCRVVTELQVEGVRDRESGCPRRVMMEMVLPVDEPVVHLDLQWFGKPAYRLPEAMWLSFAPVAPEGKGWLFDKMDRPVSPLDVVKDGGRSLHGVTSGMTYRDNAGQLTIQTLDAPLVAPGERSLLDFSNRQPDMTKGVHVNLFNNVWGTNFRMWFEEDMRFRFVLRLA